MLLYVYMALHCHLGYYGNVFEDLLFYLTFICSFIDYSCLHISLSLFIIILHYPVLNSTLLLIYSSQYIVLDSTLLHSTLFYSTLLYYTLLTHLYTCSSTSLLLLLLSGLSTSHPSRLLRVGKTLCNAVHRCQWFSVMYAHNCCIVVDCDRIVLYCISPYCLLWIVTCFTALCFVLMRK